MWIMIYNLLLEEEKLSLAFIHLAEVLSSDGHYMGFLPCLFMGGAGSLAPNRYALGSDIAYSY
jgi:hypothetical protein